MTIIRAIGITTIIIVTTIMAVDITIAIMKIDAMDMGARIGAGITSRG